MPKLNLRTANRIKIAAGEVVGLKGAGFAWPAGDPPGGGEVRTFGNNNGGATDTPLPGNTGRAFMSRFQLTEAGTLNHVAVYSSVNSAGLIRGLVYADSAGSPGARVAVGAPVAVFQNAFAVSACSGQALSPGWYWIGAITEDYQSNVMCQSTGGTGWAQWGDSNYASPPNPWSGGGAADYLVAAYAEYTTV